MQTCPYCKSDVPDGSAFCDHCGEELYFCLKCRRLSAGKWCTRCGSQLVKASDSASQLVVTPSQRVDDRVKDKMAKPVESVEQPAPAEDTLGHKGSAHPKLVRVDDESFVVEIHDGAVIGRTQGDYVDLFGSMGYVSGRHAVFDYDEATDEWTITDLGSTNGTKLNGIRLKPDVPTPFDPGDVIKIAYTEFTVL